MNKDALKEAIEVLGSQTALAAVCGERVKQGHVHYWLTKSKDGVPPKYCDPIERATAAKGRVVSKTRLRPDVYAAAESQEVA